MVEDIGETECHCECHCGCHENPDILHCMPCCNECPYCGKRLKFGYDEHVDRHVQRGHSFMLFGGGLSHLLDESEQHQQYDGQMNVAVSTPDGSLPFANWTKDDWDDFSKTMRESQE